MTYEEMRQKAIEDNQMDQLTIPIHSWKSEGEELIGLVKEIKEFQDSKFETSCKQYIIHTDTGLVSTVLGAASDKQLEKQKILGRVIWIIYKGKGSLDDGRQFNKFEIKDISPDT